METMQELICNIVRYDEGEIDGYDLGDWVFQNRYELLKFLEEYQELKHEKESHEKLDV